jgi:uncharacterized protein
MTFLTAEWRKLLMVNYEVPTELLVPYLPYGTELDLWQSRCYVSLVGFMFLKTKILGLSIPFHRDFEEVNLRFYVRPKNPDSLDAPRRGVVFIKEIVPKPAITLIANGVYGENYETHRMRHAWDLRSESLRVSYEWKPFFGPAWYKMAAETESIARPIAKGSEEEFITEHYWGYASVGAKSTNEYQVEHPRWDVYKVLSHEVQGDFGKLYGSQFEAILKGIPTSVFVAEGSEISVLGKSKIA